MEILIASNNKGKIEEFKSILEHYENLKVVTTAEAELEDYIPREDGDTFKKNAFIKAKSYYSKVHIPVIADDSGLCVDELDDEPGVLSARYAGENATNVENIDKLLKELSGEKDRDAYFECCICYYDGVGVFYAEGKVKGKISTERRGEGGFGYDPVFIPNGYDKTFAELDISIKNKISHRAKAMEDFREHIAKKLGRNEEEDE
ncbi:MAG: XTP/dITP diphosphatase [Candidatus Kapaibacteriales bacterium]